MARRIRLVDSDGLSTGNSWNRVEDEEEGFRSLLEAEDGCPYCNYEGSLRSTRKGWRCPRCREIVIPSE